MTDASALVAEVSRLPLVYAAVACATRVVDLPIEVLPERMLTGAAYNVVYCKAHRVHHVYDRPLSAKMMNDVHRDVMARVRRVRATGEGRAVVSVAGRRELMVQAGKAVTAAELAYREDRKRFGAWRNRQVSRARGLTTRERVRQQAEVRSSSWTKAQQVEFYRCFRKQVYVFREQASAALATRPEAVAEMLSVYSCEFCSGWHLGHPPKQATVVYNASYVRKASHTARMYVKHAREFDLLLAAR